MLNEFIDEAIKKARKDFGIDDYPGNLFNLLASSFGCIDRYKLVIFKEDLDELSGFIGYENKYAFIGINCNRPIGHQNLTLGHELGHLYLNHGSRFSDKNIDNEQEKEVENEAFNFGMELIYPEKYFNKDFHLAFCDELFNNNNAGNLGLYINDICHKYFLSFEAVLRRFLYKKYLIKDYQKIVDKIDAGLGMHYTELDKNFYDFRKSSYSKKLQLPYDYLKDLVMTAVKQDEISIDTANSILFSYGMLGDK